MKRFPEVFLLICSLLFGHLSEPLLVTVLGQFVVRSLKTLLYPLYWLHTQSFRQQDIFDVSSIESRGSTVSLMYSLYVLVLNVARYRRFINSLCRSLKLGINFWLNGVLKFRFLTVRVPLSQNLPINITKVKFFNIYIQITILTKQKKIL